MMTGGPPLWEPNRHQKRDSQKGARRSVFIWVTFALLVCSIPLIGLFFVSLPEQRRESGILILVCVVVLAGIGLIWLARTKKRQ